MTFDQAQEIILTLHRIGGIIAALLVFKFLRWLLEGK